MIRVTAKWLVVCLACLGLLGNVHAAANIDGARLDQEIQAMKSDALSLARDLALLDSGMLSTSGNPLVMYLSLDTDEGFEPKAVDLFLNDEFAARREFDVRTADGLSAGGIQRLYVKNLPPGDYSFRAELSGTVGKGKQHHSSATFQVHKTEAPKTLELKIVNFRQKYVPEIMVKEWELSQ